MIACTADQCICGKCGKETSVIGYESAEQLDVEPAKYFVRVTKREKRACKGCEEEGVHSAPLPARIIDKGLASDRLVIETVVSKYADHCPLYRQSAILARETGIDLSRATLDGWVMRVGELLGPISRAMAQELLAGNYIQADGTPVGVQSESVRGKNHQGRHNWIHIGSEQAGPRVAAIVSVVETCRRLKIPVRDYLGSVLPGLGNFPINRIAELTPAACQYRQISSQSW